MMQVAAELLYARGEELLHRMAEVLSSGKDGRKPRVAIINGINHAGLAALSGQAGELIVQQSRRDACLELQRAGYAITRNIRQGPFDMLLVLAGRQREQTMGWLAKGMRLLDGSDALGGGIIALCAANTMGARGYEKRLAELAADLSVSSKSKCRFSFLHRGAISRPEVLEGWLADAAPRLLPDSGLISCPGVFSWEHPDAGSRLLLEHLPERLSGRGMDLGCGYGYLSCHVLGHYPDIREWHALDVDAVAVDCAAQNMGSLNTSCSVHTHWLDATQESMPGGMDVVLMNPPFHKDKADLVSLGQAMIMAAQRSMHARGSLFLVANRHLPYELLLYESFERVSMLFEGGGYKIIRCDGVSS